MGVSVQEVQAGELKVGRHLTRGDQSNQQQKNGLLKYQKKVKKCTKGGSKKRENSDGPCTPHCATCHLYDDD